MSKSMKALQSSTRRAFALGFALTFLFGGGVVSAQPTPDRFVSFSEFVQAAIDYQEAARLPVPVDEGADEGEKVGI